MSKSLDSQIVNNLLDEFKEQRESLKDMILELDELKTNLSKLFPDKLDSRYRNLYDEKLKTVTSFLNLLLDIKKEITRSIKDEIEIRRRIKVDDDSINLEDLLDLRSIVSKVEKFEKQTDNKKKQVDKKKEIVLEEK